MLGQQPRRRFSIPELAPVMMTTLPASDWLIDMLLAISLGEPPRRPYIFSR